MGGGNGQKSKTARLRNLEKQKPAKGTSRPFGSGALDLSFFTLISDKSNLGHQLIWLSACRKPARLEQESNDNPGKSLLIISIE